MGASTIYKAPFSNLHVGGPDSLFIRGEDNVTKGLFDALKDVHSGLSQQVK